MNFYSIELLILIFLGICLNISANRHHDHILLPRAKREKETDNIHETIVEPKIEAKKEEKEEKEYQFTDIYDLFACSNELGLCTIVKEFSIHPNNTFKCYENSIGILYRVKADDTKQFFGYLTPGPRYKVSSNQILSKTCHLFKK